MSEIRIKRCGRKKQKPDLPEALFLLIDWYADWIETKETKQVDSRALTMAIKHVEATTNIRFFCARKK